MRRVFLSSVSRGLEPCRDAVSSAVEGLDGYHCVRMEDFGARDSIPSETCREKIAECDIFVGIVGHQYGTLVPGTNVSYSEYEYNLAKEYSKPRLMFEAPSEAPIQAHLIEADSHRERQKAFRATVREECTIVPFTSDDRLAIHVLQAIHNFVAKSATSLGLAPEVRTQLLFPFVTSQAGFDTGIVISNTNADPCGSEQRSGSCTLYFYGTMRPGGLVPTTQTTDPIHPGEQLVFSLSTGGGTLRGNEWSGSMPLVNSTPGFQGYIIIDCGFPNARGFAMISDFGCQKVAAGYLAEVIARTNRR